MHRRQFIGKLLGFGGAALALTVVGTQAEALPAGVTSMGSPDAPPRGDDATVEPAQYYYYRRRHYWHPHWRRRHHYYYRPRYHYYRRHHYYRHRYW